jgi:hypothetical protein
MLCRSLTNRILLQLIQKRFDGIELRGILLRLLPLLQLLLLLLLLELFLQFLLLLLLLLHEQLQVIHLRLQLLDDLLTLNDFLFEVLVLEVCLLH